MAGLKKLVHRHFIPSVLNSGGGSCVLGAVLDLRDAVRGPVCMVTCDILGGQVSGRPWYPVMAYVVK